MVSSWFRGTGADHSASSAAKSIKDVVRALYPKTNHYDQEDRGHFSQLLLEHGEKHLQDWAVIAFSSPLKESKSETVSPHHRRSDKIKWAQSPLVGGGSSTSRRSSKGSRDASSGTRTPRKASVRPHSNTKNPVAVDKESFPSGHMVRVEGRLHLCSRSLVFEPNERSSRRGVLRCPFSRMDAAPREYPADAAGFESMCVEFASKKHLVMRVNNLIGPFESVSVPVRFQFTFLHSSPSSFVDLCTSLFQMAMDGKNKPSHVTPELDALLKPMLDRPFNTDNLVDIREQLLVSNMRVRIVTPLQEKPGVLAITAERVYFQPASGVLTTTEGRASKWRQRDVIATARRYNGLRDSALEIYWKDETSTLLAFERRHAREMVMRFLRSVLCFTDREFVKDVYQEWQKGAVSNYDYLLAVNSAAGRSFHDLSRYPVFPWVIADYDSNKLDLAKEKTFRDLSKPMGALNEERLEYFRNRLKGMQEMDEAFLYGTHYSAPGYVLYYLVRSMPEHMLCLQNGRFDAPDRMFHSIKHCFDCTLSNHADLKELIPEFYNAGNDFDFLINARGLQLGATQIGDRVDDVQLPPWARSARDFVKKNRKALESDICTRMLPRWIDLIFGNRSRGSAAMEASNLFHHMAYLGPADLAGMKTEEERFQAELQATEFGIVPDMLFCGPHPLRHDAVNEDFISPDIGRSSGKDDGTSGRETWELLDAPPPDGMQLDPKALLNPTSPETPVVEPVVSVRGPSGTTDVGAAALESVTSSRTAESSHATPTLSIPLRGTGDTDQHQHKGLQSFSEAKSLDEDVERTSVAPTPVHVQSFPESSSSTAEWDIKFVERSQIHTDAVSGCSLFLHETDSKESILATTALDGGLKVHKVSLGDSAPDAPERKGFPTTLSRFSYNSIINRGQADQGHSKLNEFRSHASRDPLASLVLATDGEQGHVAFAGGHDDVVLVYGINSACAVASVYSHRDAVTGLDLIERTPFHSEGALWLENSTHIMISGSWDATVKVWSASVSVGEAVAINREPIAELFDADSSIVCVSAKPVPTGGIVIGAGCADGSFCVWNIHNDGVQVVIHNEPARRGSGPCSVVKWVSVGGVLRLFAAFSTGVVASYSLVGGALERVNAVSIGVAVSSLAHMDGFLLVGSADGGLRLVPVRDDVYFGKPTLWNAVNGKSSPGISSISVTGAPSGGNTTSSNAYVCCTGGEDGSVALFELTKSGTSTTA